MPDIRLLPFFLLIVVYTVERKLFQHEPQTLTAAASKAAPILYLTAYLLLMAGREKPGRPSTQRPQHQIVAMGLLLSSVGDVCFVWKQYLPGASFFGLALAAYTMAFSKDGNSSPILLKCILLSIAVVSSLILLPTCGSPVIAAGVIVYIALLALTSYFAMRRHIDMGTVASLYGLCGGALFIASDFLVGYYLFVSPFPHMDLCIMATYYAAQYCFTMSVAF